MGFKKYRGPIETVEHAMMAHAVLSITCQDCGHDTRRYAYRLWHQAPSAPAWPLGSPVAGFWCRSCRKSVQVILKVA